MQVRNVFRPSEMFDLLLSGQNSLSIFGQVKISTGNNSNGFCHKNFTLKLLFENAVNLVMSKALSYGRILSPLSILVIDNLQGYRNAPAEVFRSNFASQFLPDINNILIRFN